MKRAIVTAAALSVAACATPDVPAALLGPPIACKGEVACKYRWGRALAWVSNNAYYRVIQANELAIQTAGPHEHSTRSAISVMRIPNPDGTETFQFQSGCGNMFGCTPTRAEMEREFRVFVMETPVPPVTAN